jgi:predicted PhzF superfamily epimerase YddE/YHI9
MRWPDTGDADFVREGQVRLSEQLPRPPRVWLYASFATHPGGGNPAGVVASAEPIPAPAAQSLAALLSVPATGFVLIHEAAAAGSASARFFTPHREIDACGHVTIAPRPRWPTAGSGGGAAIP